MNVRISKDEAVKAVSSYYGQGVYTAFIDLLEATIEEAQEEMESANENITIWRAQGKATAARDLIAAIKPRNAE